MANEVEREQRKQEILAKSREGMRLDQLWLRVTKMLLARDQRTKDELKLAQRAATARGIGVSKEAQDYLQMKGEHEAADARMIADIYAEALKFLGKEDDLEGVTKIETGLKNFLKKSLNEQQF